MHNSSFEDLVTENMMLGPFLLNGSTRLGLEKQTKKFLATSSLTVWFRMVSLSLQAVAPHHLQFHFKPLPRPPLPLLRLVLGMQGSRVIKAQPLSQLGGPWPEAKISSNIIRACQREAWKTRGYFGGRGGQRGLPGRGDTSSILAVSQY